MQIKLRKVRVKVLLIFCEEIVLHYSILVLMLRCKTSKRIFPLNIKENFFARLAKMLFDNILITLPSCQESFDKRNILRKRLRSFRRKLSFCMLMILLHVLGVAPLVKRYYSTKKQKQLLTCIVCQKMLPIFRAVVKIP